MDKLAGEITADRDGIIKTNQIKTSLQFIT